MTAGKRKSTVEIGGDKKRVKIPGFSKNDKSAVVVRSIKSNKRKTASGDQVLADSTNAKHGSSETRKDKRKSFSDNESRKIEVFKQKANETASNKASAKREIIIDDDFAPLSQSLFGFLDLESP